MQFENTFAFYFLAILPVLLLLFFAYIRWRKKAMATMGDRHLIEQLLDRSSEKRKWIKFIVILAGCTFIIIGLANLRMGSKKQKIKGESAEIIICFDVSNSMLADDVKPDRLTQAKLSATQIIEELAGNKIGLVVFAGDSYMQMPLTSDSKAALMYLNNINTGTIANQGTAIGSAIKTALLAFENGGDKDNKKGRAIIIITDGETHDADAIEVAQEAEDENIKIITLGVGTPVGGPIPQRRGNVVSGFKKDRYGNVVVTKLNETMLQTIAEESDGIYMNLNGGRKVILSVAEQVDALDKTADADFQFTEYANHFQLFLGIGLFLITLEFLLSDKKPKWIEKVDLFDEKQ